MQGSSGTPDGWPGRCPLCGYLVFVQPSVRPEHTRCPTCGHSLWHIQHGVAPPIVAAQPNTGKNEFVSGSERSRAAAKHAAVAFDIGLWTFSTGLCAGIILVADNSIVGAASWAVGGLLFGCIIQPSRCARQLGTRYRSRWLAVMLGWGICLGLPLGGPAGALTFAVSGWPDSALAGSFLGLLVVPLLTAVEGLAIAGTIVLGFWIVTGRRLDRC
jgi:hypothetical protein